MCQLLGMSANAPTDICFSWTGLMFRGGQTGPHKDGWGIAFYEGKGLREFRDPNPSATSEIARFISQYPIKSRTVISHIRQANVGDISLENTHPFIRELGGYYWCFAHNGQLKSYQDLPLGRFRPVGETDSEHAFCWLLEDVASGCNDFNSLECLGGRLYRNCLELTSRGVFNMLFTNSEYLFAYCSTKLYWITRQAPFGCASLEDGEIRVNFEEHTNPTDKVTMIVTEPLTVDEEWRQMRPGELIAFRDGAVAARWYEEGAVKPADT
ncbi:class II glutamine amidotransferase [Hahella sp. HN01]|uniref:class II glutamine amidotransferase n=1 Tax=Hahella sp. HN01 TaxID=2847262 RepID=UPI001C1F1644|nr:class II glutamine amidotransferase [Hahella sp. HN01]MBU6950513.1 class II glutamine amidotransferase [Hahella sp. HN01]